MVLKNLKSMAISRHLIIRSRGVFRRLFRGDSIAPNLVPNHSANHFGMMISGQIWRIWEFSNDLRQISQNKNQTLFWVGGIFPKSRDWTQGGPFPLRFNGKQWEPHGVPPNSWLKGIQWKPPWSSWNHQVYHCKFGEQLIPESKAKSSNWQPRTLLSNYMFTESSRSEWRVFFHIQPKQPYAILSILVPNLSSQKWYPDDRVPKPSRYLPSPKVQLHMHQGTSTSQGTHLPVVRAQRAIP